MHLFLGRQASEIFPDTPLMGNIQISIHQGVVQNDHEIKAFPSQGGHEPAAPPKTPVGCAPIKDNDPIQPFVTFGDTLGGRRSQKRDSGVRELLAQWMDNREIIAYIADVCVAYDKNILENRFGHNGMIPEYPHHSSLSHRHFLGI